MRLSLALAALGFSSLSACGSGISAGLGSLDSISISSTSALSIAPTAKALLAGGSFTVTPTGGTPPYSYSKSGVGTLSGSTYTASANGGAATLTVKDSVGRSATLPVTVVVAPVMASGRNFTCAVASGKMKCWGTNSSGQLGYGDTTNRGSAAGAMGDNLAFLDLGTGRTVASLPTSGTSASFMCAILDNGAVKCWGDNSAGELGQGTTTSIGATSGQMGDSLPAIDLGTGRTAVAIAMGKLHACAILDDTTVKCWGGGVTSYGQLGYGDTIARGNAAGEMGDKLPAVSLGTGRRALTLSLGSYHSCAILDDHSVKCWGFNNDGELGYGDTTGRGCDTFNYGPGAGYSGGCGGMGDSLAAIDLGTGRTAAGLSVSGRHSCVVLDDGGAKCWGTGGAQLGQGTSTTIGTTSGQMGDNLPEISLGSGRTAKAIYATGFNDYFTCAILDNGGVKCWGSNDKGQLGQGTTTSIGDAAGQMGDNLPIVSLTDGSGNPLTAVAITAFTHSASDNSAACALLSNGKIKCWGGNGNGELGNDSSTGSGCGGGCGAMGTALPFADLGSSFF